MKKEGDNDNVNDNDNNLLIDNKYCIKSKKGEGGYSLVFQVKDIETKKEYAAKIITKITNISKNELNICKIIKNKIHNSYIIDFISNGIGPIQKGKKISKKIEYYIFGYASKGDLWKYILQGGFKEKYSKIIFTKILEGIQALHKIDICHRDIKPHNILLDDNFNPKICDFGFATSIKGEDGSGKLYDNLGTHIFKPPQMYLTNNSYNGIKADIFSLGVTLFILVASKPCFYASSKKDKYYNNIINNHQQYESDLKKNNINISNTLLNLFYKMVAFEEKNRPDNIEEILKDEWFNEIRDLNNDERMILEEQVRLDFEKKEKDIIEKTQLKENIKIKDRILEDKDEEIEYFKNNTNIKLIKNWMKMDNYIIINGDLNPIDFMNNLAYKINYYYGCEIEPSQKNLKFNAIFKKNEEEEEEEEEELDFKNIRQNDKNCIIQVKLYKSNKDEFILRFIKKLGELNDYYHNLLNIIDKAKKLL